MVFTRREFNTALAALFGRKAIEAFLGKETGWGKVPEYPYINGVGEHTYEIFLVGQALGNRANVFSKVGDSITVDERFLTPIGAGNYDLHQEYADLAPVIEYFSQEKARMANSFANQSVAAVGGWSAQSVLYGTARIRGVCNRGEAPLDCEYRVSRPAIAIIMLGTNDAAGGIPLKAYESYMRRIVEISEEKGVIPVLTTIPPLFRKIKYPVSRYNEVIQRLSAEYQVPLIDYWTALQQVSGYGLSRDGVHPWANYDHPADFSVQNLAEAGVTVRNLLTLMALDQIWRFIQERAMGDER